MKKKKKSAVNCSHLIVSDAEARFSVIMKMLTRTKFVDDENVFTERIVCWWSLVQIHHNRLDLFFEPVRFHALFFLGLHVCKWNCGSLSNVFSCTRNGGTKFVEKVVFVLWYANSADYRIQFDKLNIQKRSLCWTSSKHYFCTVASIFLPNTVFCRWLSRCCSSYWHLVDTIWLTGSQLSNNRLPMVQVCTQTLIRYVYFWYMLNLMLQLPLLLWPMSSLNYHRTCGPNLSIFCAMWCCLHRVIRICLLLCWPAANLVCHSSILETDKNWFERVYTFCPTWWRSDRLNILVYQSLHQTLRCIVQILSLAGL